MKTVKTYSPEIKILSLILSFLVIFYLIPTSVFAEGLDSDTTVSDNSVSENEENITYTPEIYEVTELREENVKHFRLQDGSYVAAQYNYPVHYTDENGEFADIDNRLIESGSELSTDNSRIKFIKKITGNGNIFTLHENNTKITIGLQGAEKKTKGVVTSTHNSDDSIPDTLGKLTNLENISSTILYEDILDGVDIEYVVHSLNVKENIIIKERKDSYSYTFNIELNNLTAILDSNGDVYINSFDGQTRYIIPAPIVYDANNTYAPDSVAAYTLAEAGNGKYELNISVASSWMNDDNRAFPVTVDPPMMGTGGTVIDFNIDSTSPNTNTNGDQYFYVSSTERAYVKFNENYFADIPIGATITKAELNVIGGNSQSGTVTVGAYAITTNWDSTLTWNKTNASTPQGSFSNNALDYIIIDAGNTRRSWNITELYKNWLNGSSNYGVGLRLVDEGLTGNRACFTAYEYSPSDDDGNLYEPIVMVTYIYNDGLEDYYPTATHSAGSGGAGSINLSNGRLTLAIPTITTLDQIFAFTPTLVYNSSLSGKSTTSENICSAFSMSYMPYGFKLNLQETIIHNFYKDSSGIDNSYYLLYDADGTAHAFYYFNSTCYRDDEGLQLNLVVENNGDINIKDQSLTTKTYSCINGISWYLTSITDRYGNKLVLDFDPPEKPTSIKFVPNGADAEDINPQLVFLYSNNKLCAVYNDASKDFVIFRYSGNYLSSVEYYHGEQSLTEQDVWDKSQNEAEEFDNMVLLSSADYTYNSSGYITRIEDSDANKSLQYEITNGKVTKLSEYAGTTLGQQISYTYGEGYTDIRSTGNDEILNSTDDIITRYVLDNYGRAASVYSMLADGAEIYGATTGIYDSSHMSRNSIKSSAVLDGIDSEDIVESDNSGDYFATIQGGINTTEATGSYKQVIFSEENVSALTSSNSNMEFIISGFGYSNAILQNGIAEFSLGVNVYYYQQTNGSEVVVSYRFDFADVENVWQYVTGKFSCRLDSTNTANYDYVSKIEVVCSYYGQPDNGIENAYAHFKDIVFTDFTDNSGYDYTYNTNTGNLEKKENTLYNETYEYDEENRITRLETSYGDVYRYVYDDENSDGPIEYEYYEKNGTLVTATAYVYNSYGLLTNCSYLGSATNNISIYDTSSLQAINTEYEYETTPTAINFGACTKEIDSLGNATTYAYNSTNGKLAYQIHASSGTGYEYTHTYKENGEIEETVRSNSTGTSNPEAVIYIYNSSGYLDTIATDSTTYKLLYDSFGNPSGIKTGNNSLATYEYYPNNGKLKKINYGNGFSEEYLYNTLEMLTEIWYNYSDGTEEKAFEYTYNTDGTVDVFTNYLEGKNIRYKYDNRGRFYAIDENDIGDTSYNSLYRVSYDSLNRVSSQTNILSYNTSTSGISQQLITEYNYNNKSSISTETLKYLSANHKISYSYDVFSRISTVSRDFGNFDYNTSYTYVTQDEKYTSHLVASYTNTIGSYSGTYNYTYDSKGNITTIDIDGVETTYTYDHLGQLTRESKGRVTRNYTYDNAGNLTEIEIVKLASSGDQTLYALNPGLATTTTTALSYTDSEWGDLLTSYDGTTITYDTIGNPLSYYNGSAYTFTWEGRRLVGATKGSNILTFVYNDEGIRTSKTVNGVKHTYYLNGNQIVAEEWSDKLLVYLYDASGSPIGMMYRRTSYAEGQWDVYWFAKNLQGDVVSVYNEAGEQVVTYSYTTAWGEHSAYVLDSSAEGADCNPFRYRGYYYDTDLGMYYLQSRYYDAKICRFINADGQLITDHLLGANLFAYCYNNPLMYVDPTGHAPDWNLLLQGALLATMGIIAIAAVATAPVSCLLIVNLAYSTLATAGAVATTIGASEVYESFEGDNPLKEAVGEEYYDTVKYGSALIMSMGSSILSYGTTFSVCFVAGTMVKAVEGDVPIEDIQIGDYVYAHNPETGETELKPVVNTFVNEATELVHVFAGGEEIICTNEHPFYSPVKGWIAACKLRAGDILVSLNGEYVVIEQVQHEILESPIKVYNFEVEDFHTYFVGNGDGVLVHNTCSQTGSYEIIFKSGKNYVGKGGVSRMNVSAKTHSLIYNDPVVSMKWEYAPNSRTAFVDEYFKMAVRGVGNPNTYNLIWSPERSYFMEYLSR